MSVLRDNLYLLGMVMVMRMGSPEGMVNGRESSSKIKVWVAASQSFVKLFQPIGRDNAQAVLPVRVIFLLQCTLNTNQFFSALFTVVAGIFPGVGS